MYQKCPICNGTGIDMTSPWTSTDATCPVCRGQRIIDRQTGRPPVRLISGSYIVPKEFLIRIEKE
jgi:hypothetical protein